jgi:GMP synthase (glutamine-hydrolysing)
MIDKEVFNLGVPILGICYGFQLLAKLNNHKVVRDEELKEYGKSVLNVLDDSNLLKGLDKEEIMWMSHGIFILLLNHKNR